MNERTLQHQAHPTAIGAILTSARPPSLQRRCACGGLVGPDGECAECRRKRLAAQRSATGGARPGAPLAEAAPSALTAAHLGHNFGQVRVHAPEPVLSEARPAFPLRLSQQAVGDEGGGEAEAMTTFSEDGLLVSLAGSGTCTNGGGESVCDPAKGKYKITSNGNTCCTKSCTQDHEQRHVTDHDGWGCCAALATAWAKKGADRAELVKKYNTWFASANLISECNAYTNDIKCADDLAKTKDCAGAGKDTDCCKDIADYRTRYAALAKTHCDKAPKKVPACPAF